LQIILPGLPEMEEGKDLGLWHKMGVFELWHFWWLHKADTLPGGRAE
jgi:hypothetical protein